MGGVDDVPSFQTKPLMVSLAVDNYQIIPRSCVVGLAKMLRQSGFFLFVKKTSLLFGALLNYQTDVWLLITEHTNNRDV